MTTTATTTTSTTGLVAADGHLATAGAGAGAAHANNTTATATTTATTTTPSSSPSSPLTFVPPINFPRWIAENAHLLQPPVNNFCVWRSDFIIMALGGPNKRSDYHTNPTEEWFFQHKGDLLLKVVDRDGAFKDVWVREGDMLLVPANVPHNPVRFANTVGIVIEMKRPEGSNDSLSWFCEQCRALVYSESFYCYDLGTQLKPVIEKWAKQPELRVCKQCGFENPFVH